SRASSARRVSDTCQPTIRREYRSVTNDVYANPPVISTYVMSATHLRPGPSEVKSRSSRSAGRAAAGPGTVVLGFFRLAAAPAMPSSRISRSTVHRAQRHGNALPVQLTPDLPGAVHPPAFLPVFLHPLDLLLQVLIPLLARRNDALAFLRRVIR